MNDASRQHWEDVYAGKAAEATSWFRPRLDESLRLIDGLGLAPDAAMIDIGGGRATLVDDLLDRGFGDVTVLDLSVAALTDSRIRLGLRADAVAWRQGDITDCALPAAHYRLWHDRAVFHFLTAPEARARYLAQAVRAVRPGGHAIIASFAADGPSRCSGLEVCRYDARELAAAFVPGFDPVTDSREVHRTPFGTEQAFTYVVLRRSRHDSTESR